jgi:glycosyltransferase involved in cell wall biosynthesis
MFPFFTIIIPCYNLGRYLSECIDSVLQQEYKDFEIIVVDDGSTDVFTLDYLKTLNIKKVNIYHQVNQGVSAARNFGASLAKGDYLLFLDADDKIDSSYLQLAANKLKEDTTIEYIYCDVIEFEGASNYRILGELNLSSVLVQAITHVSGIISKGLWQRSSGFDTDFKHGWEDWDFLLRITELGIGFYKIPQAMLHYRIRPESRDKLANKNYEQELEQMIFTKNISTYLKVYQKPITLLREYRDQQRTIEDLKLHIQNIYATKSYKLGSFLLSPLKHTVKGVKSKR